MTFSSPRNQAELDALLRAGDPVGGVDLRAFGLAAALDELVLSTPRQVVRAILDHAVARGEIPADRDLSLIPDVALGLNVLRVITGRPIDRVYVRRMLEDVILPMAGGPAP